MGIHESYGEAFTRFAASVPAAERAAREAAFARFAAAGFPDDGIERWHYSDLSKLGQLAVTLADAALAPDPAPWSLSETTRQVWHNARALQPNLPRLGFDLDTVHAGFAGLHQAFAQDGLQLEVAANTTLAQPVHALMLSSGSEPGAMHHLAHRIRLGRGARAAVIIEHAGLPGAARLHTQSLHVDLADNAELTLVRVQDESETTTQWLQTAARLARDARLKIINIDLGGGLVRNDWNVGLAAAGASAEIAGLFAIDGSTRLDNQYEIEHAAAHGTSRENFRGLGFGRSRAVLNGRVVVRPGAVKTDSEQRIANLLLARGAEINAKPELEIYADDVKCAHGNSCGQLDAKAVFYLRSRGVPDALARALLTYGFASEILVQIPHAGLQRRIAQRVVSRLGAGLDLDLFDEVAA